MDRIAINAIVAREPYSIILDRGEEKDGCLYN